MRDPASGFPIITLLGDSVNRGNGSPHPLDLFVISGHCHSKSNSSGVASERSSLAMSEENKTQARRFFEEGFGQGNTGVVDEVLDPDFVCYDPNSESGEVRGAET